MRKVGSEAPAAKVMAASGEKIIGMIAVNVQLIFYAKDIDTILPIVTKCDKKFIDEQKLSFITVCDNDLESIGPIIEQNEIKKCEIYSDTLSQFHTKFKIGDNELGVFLVDKEGIFEYVYYGDVAQADLKSITQKAIELANKKQKGHTHENWMR